MKLQGTPRPFKKFKKAVHMQCFTSESTRYVDLDLSLVVIYALTYHLLSRRLN